MGCPGREGGNTDCEIRVEKAQKQLIYIHVAMKDLEKIKSPLDLIKGGDKYVSRRKQSYC